MASPVTALQDAGFSEDEIASWTSERRAALGAGGFKDNEIDAYFAGGVTVPEGVPASFAQRFVGEPQALPEVSKQMGPGFTGRLYAAMTEGASAGFGENPIGLPPEDTKKLQDIGIFAKPDEPYNVVSGIRFLNEAMIRPAYGALQTVFRGVNAAIYGAGAVGGQIAAEVTGGNEAEQARARRDGAQFATIATLLMGGHPVSRNRAGPAGEMVTENIGALPRSDDFVNAARVTAGEDAPMPVQQKMLRLWEEKGIHPAEAAADAQRDPVIAQRLLSKDQDDLPYVVAGDSPEFVALSRRLEEAQTEWARLNKEANEALDRGDSAGAERLFDLADEATAKENAINLEMDAFGSGRKDFGAAAQGGGDGKLPPGGKPAEAAADAQRDPVIAQRLLSKDPEDMPYEVKAFHGSPHAFDEFDPNKAPFYFTPDPSVASGYAQRAAFSQPTDTPNVRPVLLRMEKPFEVDRRNDVPSVFNARNPDWLRANGYDSAILRDPLDPKATEYIVLSTDQIQPRFSEGGKKPPAPPKPPEPPPEGSYEAAQKAVLDRISVGERGSERTWDIRRIYTEFVDELHPIKAVSEDAYQAARLTRGQFGKVEQFLERATFDFKTLENTGKPLREIVEPVAKDMDGLRAYITARRAIEVEASGRKTGVDLDAARQVVEGGKKYETVARELTAYQNRVLAYLKDSGVLTEGAFEAMVEAGRNYVPFYRVIDQPATGTGKSLGPGNPVKRLKGSEREIVDPLESIIKNTYAYISVAERNAAGIAIVDALKQQGFKVTRERPKADAELVAYLKEQGISKPEELVDFIKGAASEDGTTLSAFRNGVKESVKVDDPELVRAFRAIDRQSAGLLTRILAVPARTMRAGAVLVPEFIARNLIRDFLTAFINTKGGVFSPIDTLKGLKSVIRKDADFEAWVKSGGANSALVALDRRYMQESLAKLNGETGLMERGWNVVTSPIRGLRMISEIAENATRLGEFKKLPRGSKGEMQAAAFASREVTLDFARMGAQMRSYNMVSAFANAQIQGVDRMGRAFKDRPVNTTLKVAAGVTLPSILLWWANKDDERVKQLPQWQKDLFWIIATDDWQPIAEADAALKPDYLLRRTKAGLEFNNGSLWRVPKPFEVGVVFGSGVERVLDATLGNNPEAFKHFTKSVLEVLTPNFIPTFAQPLAEQWANRSTFVDRTLIPANLEKQLPEYQYTPYTTELSKALGRIVSAFPGLRDAATTEGAVSGPAARALSSPILIENYIRAWSGGLGMYALNGADAALRKAGVLPDPITPTPTLADIPFVKAFAVRYPSAGQQAIQDFYDDHNRSKRFFDTYMAKAREGDADATKRIQQAGGLQMFVRLDGYREALSEHSKLVRDVYKNPTMPADEKRQLIDGLYWNMIQIGVLARHTLRETEKALQAAPQ